MLLICNRPRASRLSDFEITLWIVLYSVQVLHVAYKQSWVFALIRDVKFILCWRHAHSTPELNFCSWTHRPLTLIKERSSSKTLFKPKEIVNTGFAFQRGQKTFEAFRKRWNCNHDFPGPARVSLKHKCKMACDCYDFRMSSGWNLRLQVPPRRVNWA